MDRYPLVEDIVHNILSKIYMESLKAYAYQHLHGCVIMITQLAMERSLNVEYARIAAILHDIATFKENCSHSVHAIESARIANELLSNMHLFDDDEIDCITHMIACHSHKDKIDDELSECLKDADVLTSFYSTLERKDSIRLEKLLKPKV